MNGLLISPQGNVDLLQPVSTENGVTVYAGGGGDGGGGGGDFFLACEDFGRMFDNSLPACTFLFCFEEEISSRSRTLVLLLMPESVHSGSES